MTQRNPARPVPMTRRLIAAMHSLDDALSQRLAALAEAREADATARQQLSTDLRQTAAAKPDMAGTSQRRKALIEEERRLQTAMTGLENEAAAKAKSISEITAMLDQLQHTRDSLAAQIASRHLLTQLLKALFGDAESQRKAELEQRIEKTGLQRADLEAALEDVVRQERRLEADRAQLESRRDAIQKQLRDMEERGRAVEEQYRDIHQKLGFLPKEMRQRESQIGADFQRRWRESLRSLDALCRQIRDRQPRLDELDPAALGGASRLPDALALGRVRLSYGDWSGYIPRLVPFPLERTLWLPADDDNARLLVQQLLLRIMTAFPIDRVSVVACDPLRLGRSLSPFLPLLQGQRPFTDGKILTRADEIENALQREADYVEAVLQNKFTDKRATWATYNRKHQDAPLPYRLLLMFDLPEQFTDRSLHTLGRLVEHGPRCGLLPVLTVQDPSKDDRRFASFCRTAAPSWARMDSLWTASVQHPLEQLMFQEEPDFWPSDRTSPAIFGRLVQLYADAAQFSGRLEQLLESEEMWSGRSASGLEVPLGWTPDGVPVSFQIGGISTEHHALLAGRSGSGKSNLLHVLIHGLCHRYPPSQLRLYLLDYKQGTELSGYARPVLPHAELVATESDPEYGVTVLAHLASEVERRAAEFKQQGVRDVLEYQERTSRSIPRILLIVDEFQMLFSEGRQVAEPAEHLLNKLLRQGRAYGIHVLLATQTLKGIQSLSMSQLVSQIGLRICLACSEEDSAVILGSTNWDGATLHSPPEAILNAANGAKSANQRFWVPLAERALCAAHQEELSAKSAALGLQPTTHVFDGAYLPPAPTREDVESIIGTRENVTLLLGQQLTFEAQPLCCELPRRPGANLLCVGYDPVIQGGLLAAVGLSLSASSRTHAAIYFDARGEGRQAVPGLSDLLAACAGYVVQGPDWDGGVASLPVLSPGQNGVLLVDGLDFAKPFHGGGLVSRPKLPGQAASPADAFRSLLEEGPRRGWFVVALADNWKRLSTLCGKEILGSFQFRIGFCLIEDDAGALATGNIGKLRGMEKANRAVFVDQFRNDLVWFRPFRGSHTAGSQHVV